MATALEARADDDGHVDDRATTDDAAAGDRPGPTGRAWPPSIAGVVGLAIAVWGLVIGLRPLDDNSFFTHLATGRLILDQGIPHADPYSYTVPGQAWVVQSWLASVVYAVVERLGGGGGLRLLMGLLCLALGACVWRLTRPATTLLPRVAIAAVAMGVATDLWTERPLLFGLLLLAVLLLQAEEGWDPRWALPLMWVWVNVHGSFPLGLVAVALLALGRRLDGESPRVELRLLGWASVGTVLGVVGPLGLHALSFPVELLSRQKVLHHITEWQSPTFDTYGQRLFLVQLVAAVVLVVRRPRYRVALPLAVFAAAALLGLRNVPVASVVLLPGMAVGAAGLGSIDGARRSTANAIGAAALVALAVLVTASQLGRSDTQLETYPVEAVAWLDGHELLGPDTRLVSRDYVGNYLELEDRYDQPVFIDDRYDMYPAELTEDYVRLVRGLDPGPVLARYDTGIVVWERETPLGAWLEADEGWGVVYRDDDWLIACPTAAPGGPGRCAADT